MTWFILVRFKKISEFYKQYSAEKMKQAISDKSKNTIYIHETLFLCGHMSFSIFL